MKVLPVYLLIYQEISYLVINYIHADCNYWYLDISIKFKIVKNVFLSPN